MARVAIITRHAVSNYGSFLQAYATQRCVESLGHEALIIDYRRTDERPVAVERTLLSTKPQWKKSRFKSALYLAARTPESILAGHAFAKERSRLLKTTAQYSNFEQLASNPPQADVYMTGSDQVWGPVGNGVYDNSYALAFLASPASRIAYAASFGKSDMPDEVARRFANMISRYSSVLVREDSAVRRLKDWGVESSQVLDPTLLLDGTEWRKMKKPIKDRRYVLVYQIHSDPRVGSYAERVAQAKGLPLIRISCAMHQATRKGHFRYLPSMGQFISYIDGAECLVTDSFHGTAFAINLSTPFVEVLPTNGTSSRNASILRLTGLEERVLSGDEDVALSEKPIDFERVGMIIEGERSRSTGLLASSIEAAC